MKRIAIIKFFVKNVSWFLSFLIYINLFEWISEFLGLYNLLSFLCDLKCVMHVSNGDIWKVTIYFVCRATWLLDDIRHRRGEHPKWQEDVREVAREPRRLPSCCSEFS